MTSTAPTRQAVLSTATADGPTGQRVRALLTELADVDRDAEMAERMPVNAATTAWRAELSVERRDCWQHITEALSSRSAR